jgi:hypothetical protein
MNHSEFPDDHTTNNKAITSLVFGILSIVIPLIGLVLGIIGIILSKKAMTEIRATNQNGKGLATSSLICSSVGIVIQLLAMIGLLSFI